MRLSYEEIEIYNYTSVETFRADYFDIDYR